MRLSIGRSMLALLLWLIISGAGVSAPRKVEARPVQVGGCIILNQATDYTEHCVTVRVMMGCDCAPDILPNCSTNMYCSTTVCDFDGFFLQETICF